jgi:hypothetical protein
MSRPRDFQIWWIVLFAGGFWVAIWQHEALAKLSKTAYTAVVAMTSSVRGTPPPQAGPAEDSHQEKAKRPTASKD